MKYVKTYEQKTEPQLGDYVVVRFLKNKTPLGELLERNIGKIVKVSNYYTSPKTKKEKIKYLVEFGNQDYYINEEEILDFSKNKKDLEHYITSKNYNI